MGESATKRLAAALVLCLVGALVAGLLLLEHHGLGSAVVSHVCGEGTASGCETVARSPYASVFGVPWASIGLFGSLSLAVLLALAFVAPAQVRDPAAGLALAIVAVALLVDLALLGVQALAVKAFCTLCILTYLLNGAVALVLFPARRAIGSARDAVREGVGRMAAAGWVIGSLAFAGAVGAGDLALTSLAATRAATMLGALPPPAPASASPAPASPGSPPSELERWRAQARRLQETLDDPQKLEQYFREKAAREFEQARPQRLDLKDVPSKGKEGSPVQVVEFSDFLCPYCRALAGGLAAFLPQAGNRLQLYFKNYPLDQACNASLKASTHPGACWLALGGVCAQYQGRFWAYHDKVFTTELKNPQPADVVRLGTAAGLNAAALESCINDPRTKDRLMAEIAEAQRLGVQATPTLIVNGKKLPRLDYFVQVVDKEAQTKGFPPLSAPQGN